jgi:hypothetical protein
MIAFGSGVHHLLCLREDTRYSAFCFLDYQIL